MSEDWEEKRIRAWFQALQRAREHRTPSFALVWRAAQGQQQKNRPVWTRFPVATAAALLLGIGLLAVIFFRPPPPPPGAWPVPATLVSVSEWESPTDFLLPFPGEEAVTTTPRLEESLIKLEAIMLDINDGGVQ